MSLSSGLSWSINLSKCCWLLAWYIQVLSMLTKEVNWERCTTHFLHIVCVQMMYKYSERYNHAHTQLLNKKSQLKIRHHHHRHLHHHHQHYHHLHHHHHHHHYHHLHHHYHHLHHHHHHHHHYYHQHHTSIQHSISCRERTLITTALSQFNKSWAHFKSKVYVERTQKSPPPTAHTPNKVMFCSCINHM